MTWIRSKKLRFILNKDIAPVLADREDIIAAINSHYGQSETESVDSMLSEFTDTQIDFTETEATSALNTLDESDSPVVKLVNLLIQEAIKARASDIHIEPFGDRIRVRYRIDGVLVERDSPPRRLQAPLTSPSRSWGTSTFPKNAGRRTGGSKCRSKVTTLTCTSVCCRPSMANQPSCVSWIAAVFRCPLKDLGFSDEDHKRFQTIIKRPNGIFLVTGPTGSGKTTTLYAALNELNRPDRKIITAEDPVEYYLPGINQVEVKHNIGLDFARIIRSMLRQAPNIILVGEIRDKETAEIAVQASLTGHLVFSTLHTNNAPRRYYTIGRYWRAAIPHRIVGDRHHGTAIGTADLSKM